MITGEIVNFIQEEISRYRVCADDVIGKEREKILFAVDAMEELLAKLCDQEFSM